MERRIPGIGMVAFDTQHYDDETAHRPKRIYPPSPYQCYVPEGIWWNGIEECITIPLHLKSVMAPPEHIEYCNDGTYAANLWDSTHTQVTEEQISLSDHIKNGLRRLLNAFSSDPKNRVTWDAFSKTENRVTIEVFGLGRQKKLDPNMVLDTIEQSIRTE